MTLSEEKQIEHLATNTVGLKDFTGKAYNKKGYLKKGYHRLKDNRIIRLADLYNTEDTPVEAAKVTELGFDIETEAEKHPQLRNLKGIGWDKQAEKPKRGFALLESGKIISIKALVEAVKSGVGTTD